MKEKIAFILISLFVQLTVDAQGTGETKAGGVQATNHPAVDGRQAIQLQHSATHYSVATKDLSVFSCWGEAAEGEFRQLKRKTRIGGKRFATVSLVKYPTGDLPVKNTRPAETLPSPFT